VTLPSLPMGEPRQWFEEQQQVMPHLINDFPHKVSV